MVKKIKTPLVASLALSLAYIIWGINTPLIKLGLESFPTTSFIALKMISASLILLPFALKTWKRMELKTFLLLSISSIIWVSVGNLAFYEGLKRVPSINGAVIELLGPLLLFILSIEFLRDKFKLQTFIGIIVAFAGSLFVIGKPFFSEEGTSNSIGILMIILAVLCHVLGTIIVKPVIRKVSASQATFIHLIVGGLPIAIYSLITFGWAYNSLNKNSVIVLIYGIVAVTFANFLLVYGLKRKKTSEIGVFFYLQPLTTIVAAFFILGEKPDIRFMVGLIMVFIGIYLSEAKIQHRIHIHYRHHHH